jgi:hypothetical protein
MKTLKQTIKLLAVMAIGFGLLAVLFTQLNVVVKAAPADQLDVCATCTYTTIQTAVIAANPGDTIRVAAGTYTGMMSDSELTATVVLTKDLVLLGGFNADFSQRAPDTYVTTIDTEGNLWGGVLIYGSQSEVDGFHIVNAYGGGVAVANNQSVTAVGTITHNRIAYNRIMTDTLLSTGGAGVNVANGAEVVIAYNEILSNTVEREYSYGGGIQVVGSTVEIFENVIAYNLSHEEAVGGGIDLYQATAVISNNNIHHNAINGIGIYQSTTDVMSNTIDSNTAYAGGGIEVSSGSIFTITNNIISNNIAQLYSGGGIAVFGQSTGVIIGNEIVNNTAEEGGGIGAYENSDLTISNNTISSNSTPNGGGGIHINPDDYNFSRTSQLTITGNVVQNNNASVGAGMFIDNVNGDVTITANDIRNNQIDPNAPDYEAGGIHVWGIGGQIEVANNIFVDNDNRALKAANFSHILVVNNSVVGTLGDGIDVFSWPSTPPEPSVAQVMNNIIVGQTGCGVTTFNGITLYVDYNLFYNNDTDICGDTTVPPHANIFADPLFADALNGDFKLHSTSPAIDSGAAGPNVPDVDIEGSHRPQGDGIDMGAYEAVRYALFLPVTIKPVLVP